MNEVHGAVLEQVAAGVRAAGGHVSHDEPGDLLTINHEIALGVVVSRCRQTSAGYLEWTVRLGRRSERDLVVVVRMDAENENPRDYYLLPRFETAEPVLVLRDYDGFPLDSYRIDTLDALFPLAARRHLREVA